MGSSLHRDRADGSLAYLTAAQALNLDAPPLSLPFSWVTDGAVSDCSAFYQRRDALVAGAPLSEVRALCGFVRVAVYSTFMRWAESMGRPFSTFGYDWRRDPWETADLLLARVHALSAEHGGVGVQVVAHSNGGLLTLIALNRDGGAPVHSVIYAGTPFRPAFGTLRPFREGLTLGLRNTASIPASGAASVSGRYTFLPLGAPSSGDGRASVRAGDAPPPPLVDVATGARRAQALPVGDGGTSIIDADTGEVIEVDLRDAATWERWALLDPEAAAAGQQPEVEVAATARGAGAEPSSSGAEGQTRAGRAGGAALAATLARVALARDHLDGTRTRPGGAAYPPSVVLGSKQWMQRREVYTARGERILWGAPLPAGMEPGDGTVRWAAMMPPHAGCIAAIEVRRGVGHQALLNDLTAVRAAMGLFTY